MLFIFWLFHKRLPILNIVKIGKICPDFLIAEYL